MQTLKLSHDEVRLLNDMFSCISDLGLFDDYTENEQDSSPDVFDKLWDKVTKLWSHFFLSIFLLTMNNLKLISIVLLSAFVVSCAGNVKETNPTSAPTEAQQAWDNLPIDTESDEEFFNSTEVKWWLS